MKRLSLLLVLYVLFAAMPLLAQERADSIGTDGGLTAEDIEQLTRPIDPAETSVASAAMDPMSGTVSPRELGVESVLDARYQAPPLFRVMPERSFYPSWTTGYMYGYSGQYNDWLRGYQATAGIGLYQQLGDYWTASAYASVSKNSIYYNTATLGGQLTWRPNQHFSVTAFGMYSPGTFMSTVDFGPTFNWGGYMTLEGEHFGIDLGARQAYDPMFGHEVTPIVQPFLKLGGAKLGIDLGPMLKDALRKDRHDGPGFNPIPQPIKAVPQIAPRR